MFIVREGSGLVVGMVATIEAARSDRWGEEVMMLVSAAQQRHFLIPPTAFAHIRHRDQFGVTTGRRWAGTNTQRREGDKLGALGQETMRPSTLRASTAV